MVCSLIDRSGEKPLVTVVDRKRVRIGRAPDCDLVLRDESVSRHHAEVTRLGDSWRIRDLDSKNGIRVNTYRTRQQRLRDGDRIDLGAMRLYVEIGEASNITEARVVFEQEEHAGHRTGIIEMDRLDELLATFNDSEASLSGDLDQALYSSPNLSATVEPGALLGLFSKAAEALLTCESLDQTLERILALVFDNLPAERGVICFYDEESDTTEPKVMRTSDGGTNEPIAISTNIANDVIKRRQSLLVQNTRMDERFGAAESVIAMQIHSAMCAPLYRDGRVAGFIYVDRQSEKHPFSPAHLQALSTLAILSAVAVEQTALRDEIRHEQDIRRRLARYSSPAVVDRIVKATPAASEMVSHEGEVTVMFADLTGFTAMAERLPPASVIKVLNQVFERLTDAVFEFEGTLDKFRGDGLMAFWGAPLSMVDHAERAVSAALKMQETLADLNTMSSDARELGMRIGIHSGNVVVGDIGSPQRKDYTVIGDVVNTASRLESSVAQPGQVIVGPDTYDRIKTRFRCESLDEVQLKGKRKSVRPHLVLERIRTLHGTPEHD